MTTRKLKAAKFAALEEKLIKEAEYNPSDECYNLTMQIDKTDYILKLQLVDENRVLLWNALKINHSDNGKGIYQLIEAEKILSAMLDILLWQKEIMFNK